MKAIEDGVDVLDCPVQLSKDGIPFCLSSINLIDSTTAAQSEFSNLTSSVPEIKSGTGIFAFDLTWSDIQKLRRKFKQFSFAYSFGWCSVLQFYLCGAGDK